MSEPVMMPLEGSQRVDWRVRRRLRGGSGSGVAVAGTTIVLVVCVAAVFAPWVAPYSPNAQHFSDVLQGPSSAHWFGTDQFGRDVLSRVIYAARVDLVMGLSIVGIALVIGTTIGLVAGYLGGWFDTCFMRIVDVAMAFPFLLLVTAVAAGRGAGLSNLIFSVSLVAWVSYARLIRAEVITAKESEYMLAASASGYTVSRRLIRHLLPNVFTQAGIYASSDVVVAILTGSAVSFLGLGVQPPTAEWGSMVAGSESFVATAWWLPLFPGLAVMVTGIGFALLGDGLAARFARDR